MCTAVYMKDRGLFGRTLDLEYSYNEGVTVTPKGYAFEHENSQSFLTEYSIIGMAHTAGKYPLYYDAVNEHGLAMAGLNFPKSALYSEPEEGTRSLACFELIPYILGHCRNLSQALNILKNISISKVQFSKDYPLTPLHWMIADREDCFVVESTKEGLRLFRNDIGVMTNEPPFPCQKLLLQNYSHLTSEDLDTLYSRGLGSFGLPGDFSSCSRFVRGAFLLRNSLRQNENPTDFFKLCESLMVPAGAIRLKNGKSVTTRYTSCMDLSEGIYYYKTYENSRICAVSLKGEKSESLSVYPLRKEQDIFFEQNPI